MADLPHSEEQIASCVEIFRCLSEPHTLKMCRVLVNGGNSIERLQEELGLGRGKVVERIERLVRAGLIETGDDGIKFSSRYEGFIVELLSLPPPPVTRESLAKEVELQDGEA